MVREESGFGTFSAVSPRTGRPPSEDPRRRSVNLRLTEEEYLLLMEVAAHTDTPVAVWARERVVAAARRARRG